MDGKIIASFELPSSVTTSPQQPFLDAPSNDNEKEWSTYSDPIICWASFCTKDDTNNTSSSSCIRDRSHNRSGSLSRSRSHNRSGSRSRSRSPSPSPSRTHSCSRSRTTSPWRK